MDRRYAVAAFMLSAALFASLMYVLLSTLFPVAHFIPGQLTHTEPFDEIGKNVSGFLWENRGLDLLIESLLLFATAVCCLAMLKAGRR